MKERERRLLFNDALHHRNYTAPVADKLNMSKERQWSDTDKRQREYWEKNLSQRHFVRH